MRGAPRDNRKGFTLIELLIVVVIIGILAAIAIPKFQAVRMKGYRAAMMADLRNLASLQELYYNDAFSFSTDQAALEAQWRKYMTSLTPDLQKIIASDEQ